MRMRLEPEAFVEFDLELGRVGLAVFVAACFGVEELKLSLMVPGDRERREFVEPGQLFLGEMLQEGIAERCGLGFFGEGQALESLSQSPGNSGSIERGELQSGEDGDDEIDSGDKLFQLMVEQ